MPKGERDVGVNSKFPDRCLDDYPSIYRSDILKGKYALITGGGSGINFRVSEGLMRHGCNIAIVSRSLDRVEHAANELNNKVGKQNGTKCICYSMDVTDYAQVESVVSKILSQFGKIDILINGAAGNFLCAASDLSRNAFNKVLQIDTVGTFNATKAVTSLYMMKENKNTVSGYNGGNIVNITACLHYTGTPLQIHSSAAKAAVDAMTKVFCNEWGKYGIRVNGVSPGPIDDTTGMDKLGGFMAIEKIPSRRYGRKKDIADAVLYMVSDAASYVNGETLVVDGGSWMNGQNDLGRRVLNDPKRLNFIRAMKKPKSKPKQSKL